MFTTLLFDHIFDIDDIICALCGEGHTGAWTLNTRTGELTPLAEKDAATWVDTSHQYLLTPLPLSFLTTLELTLTQDTSPRTPREDILKILKGNKAINDLFHALDDSHASTWVYEQIKQMAMLWLDDRHLIPPSIRYVRPATPLTDTPQTTTIKIDVPS